MQTISIAKFAMIFWKKQRAAKNAKQHFVFRALKSMFIEINNALMVVKMGFKVVDFLENFPVSQIFEHIKGCNEHVEETPCKFCSVKYKSALQEDHYLSCEKIQRKCVGTGCEFMGAKQELEQHEEKCEFISQQCVRCKENVPKVKQQTHDCVDSLLQRFKKRSAELTELTQGVEKINLDIQKQQVILEKLNVLNNEKMKKVSELERYMHLKRSKPPPKDYNFTEHERSFQMSNNAQNQKRPDGEQGQNQELYDNYDPSFQYQNNSEQGTAGYKRQNTNQNGYQKSNNFERNYKQNQNVSFNNINKSSFNKNQSNYQANTIQTTNQDPEEVVEGFKRASFKSNTNQAIKLSEEFLQLVLIPKQFFWLDTRFFQLSAKLTTRLSTKN
eukprot:403365481